MTTEEQLRAYPDCGPAWRHAIELGIDVTLLEENLELSVDERLEQVKRQLEFVEALRSARGDAGQR